MCFRLDFSQFKTKKCKFLQTFCRNSCRINFFAIPLQTLSRTNETSSKTSCGCVKKALIKKEFFEKIYINRQVVQEARI